MSHEELAVARAEEAARAPPPPPKPSELKVAARMRETRRLSDDQLKKTLAFCAQRGVSEGEAVVLLRFANEDDVIATEAELTTTRWMSGDQLAAREVPADVVELVPKDVCLELSVCPLARESDGAMVVAMRHPGDRSALERLTGLALGARVHPVRVGPAALRTLIDRLHSKLDGDDPGTWLER
jgi:hypothetical protein